jgi:hypothetical protein
MFLSGCYPSVSPVLYGWFHCAIEFLALIGILLQGLPNERHILYNPAYTPPAFASQSTPCNKESDKHTIYSLTDHHWCCGGIRRVLDWPHDSSGSCLRRE